MRVASAPLVHLFAPVPTLSAAHRVRLSVIVPALNEAATLGRVVERVVATRCANEILVVDDGSTDGTTAAARACEEKFPGLVRCLRHDQRRGKGAAVRTGLAVATGDVVLVQDADLEYDPAEYPALLAPFADPQVQAVYGSRNLHPNPRSSDAFYWGGRLLSAITNLLFGTRITDESTGYKVIRASVLRELDLRADGFAFCPELTARLLRRGVQIHEVPISYQPRTRAEGKKIRWRDGLWAVAVLVRLRFSRPRAPVEPAPMD